MKKTTKIIVVSLLTLVMLFTGVTASASEGVISPRYTNISTCNFFFTASSSGGNFTGSYLGISGNFSSATVTVKVQKQFLFLFWLDVGEWTSTSTKVNGTFSHNFALDGSGTYKATITLTIKGTSGVADTVTQTIESSY